MCRAKTRRFPEILSVLEGNYDTWKVAGCLGVAAIVVAALQVVRDVVVLLEVAGNDWT